MPSIPISAVCAAFALCVLPLPAAAADSSPAAKPGVAKPTTAKPTAAKRATPRHRAATEAPPPAASPQSYELVPSTPAGSALARARQNSFSSPDDDAPPPGYRRHGGVGVGLGGGNGTTPGVSLGF